MKYMDMGMSPYKDTKKAKRKKLIKFGTSAFLVGVVLYAGYLFYWPISQLISEIISHPGIVFSLIRDPNAELNSSNGRTNVLLLGIDKRAAAPYSYRDSTGAVQKNGFLTDTIIVLSVGKETKDAVMISIPRDTWVNIPGWENVSASSGKINSVYSLGNTQDYPGGGLSLAKEVVSFRLGIPIHYAVRIDFEGFKKTVDTLGGIEVDVERAFDDYRYPIDGKENEVCVDKLSSCRYTYVHFDKGSQTMDGEKALQFVRSRTGTNGEGSDFARAVRQQKVLAAARSKALSLGNLLSPTKISSLLKEFGESVETDFNLTAYPAAFNLLKEVDVNSAKKLVLDSSKDGLLYTPDSSQYGGAFVLLPKDNSWDRIKEEVDRLLFPKIENSQ